MLFTSVILFAASALLGAQDATATFWWWPHDQPGSRFAFTGCTNALNTWVGLFSFNAPSAQQCVAQCGGWGEEAFWGRSTGSCRCGPGATSTLFFDTPFATGVPNNCPVGTYESYKVRTDFQFVGCAAALDTSNALRHTVRYVQSDAFSICNSKTEILVQKKFPTSFGFDVFCYSQASPPRLLGLNPVTCNVDKTFFVYGPLNDVPPPSGIVARRNAERQRTLLQERLRRNPYCPAGRTPCKVSGDDADGYECIDLDTELEQCGGCLNGQFGNAALAALNATAGVNCNDLTQFKKGGATCSAGKCVGV